MECTLHCHPHSFTRYIYIYIYKYQSETIFTFWQQKSINRYVYIVKLVFYCITILHMVSNNFICLLMIWAIQVTIWSCYYLYSLESYVYCHKDGLDKIGGKYVHHFNVRYENKNSNLAKKAIITAQVVILFLVNTICNWVFSIGAIHVLLSIRQPWNKYLRDSNCKELIP